MIDFTELYPILLQALVELLVSISFLLGSCIALKHLKSKLTLTMAICSSLAFLSLIGCTCFSYADIAQVSEETLTDSGDVIDSFSAHTDEVYSAFWRYSVYCSYAWSFFNTIFAFSFVIFSVKTVKFFYRNEELEFLNKELAERDNNSGQ